MHSTIFLLGYMCVGKTTLGQELARIANCDFYDLDCMIEQESGMTAREIFARLGEPHFRTLEQRALRQAAGLKAVVACGGGTPCYGDNMAVMNAKGVTVWLTAAPEVIAARLILPEQKQKRPTIAPLSDEQVLPHVIEALQRRSPHYAMARMRFDATDIETAHATRMAAQRLFELLEST